MPEQSETLEKTYVRNYREAQRIASKYGIHIIGFTNPTVQLVGGRVIRQEPWALISVIKEHCQRSGAAELWVMLRYQGTRPEISADFDSVPQLA